MCPLCESSDSFDFWTRFHWVKQCEVSQLRGRLVMSVSNHIHALYRFSIFLRNLYRLVWRLFLAPFEPFICNWSFFTGVVISHTEKIIRVLITFSDLQPQPGIFGWQSTMVSQWCYGLFTGTWDTYGPCLRPVSAGAGSALLGVRGFAARLWSRGPSRRVSKAVAGAPRSGS